MSSDLEIEYRSSYSLWKLCMITPVWQRQTTLKLYYWESTSRSQPIANGKQPFIHHDTVNTWSLLDLET